MVKILNVGSVNIDHVMEVPAFVRPGETLASTGYQIFGGGKGANQSVAIARAGAHVRHIGKIGRDGLWLRDLLAEAGVDVSALQVGETHTGFAMIQVDRQGENAIILYPGGNFEFGEDDLDDAFTEVSPGDWLLLQNEIAPQTIAAAIEKGAELGLQIALNPAPMKDNIRELPLEKLSLLILNELEGESLAGCSDPSQIIERLQARYPHLQIVLTLGREGVLWAHGDNQCHQPAYD
ncbi:MAG: ribokinase, partial [Lentisphaerae bacterium]